MPCHSSKEKARAPSHSAASITRTVSPRGSSRLGRSSKCAWAPTLHSSRRVSYGKPTGEGGGFAIETPEPRQGVVSVFTLPELVALSNSELVHTTCFDQCRYGAPSAKPTAVMYFRGRNSSSDAATHQSSSIGRTGAVAPFRPSGRICPWPEERPRTAYPRPEQRRPIPSASIWRLLRPSSAPVGFLSLDKQGGAPASPYL